MAVIVRVDFVTLLLFILVQACCAEYCYHTFYGESFYCSGYCCSTECCDDNFGVGGIIGCVLGALIFIGIVIACYCIYYRRQAPSWSMSRRPLLMNVAPITVAETSTVDDIAQPSYYPSAAPYSYQYQQYMTDLNQNPPSAPSQYSGNSPQHNVSYAPAQPSGPPPTYASVATA